MAHLELIRERYGDQCTRGTLILWNDGGTEVFMCDALENPWLDNKPTVSCIPTGTYPLKKRTVGGFYNRYNKKFGHEFVPHITKVKGRTYILIHRGNDADDTSGCLLVGYNKDILPDWIGNSTQAYKRLYEEWQKYNPTKIIVRDRE